MIHRPGGPRLSEEEAFRYTEDERQNLRSWGIEVPEPTTTSPDEEVPMEPTFVFPSSPFPSGVAGQRGAFINALSAQTAFQQHNITGFYNPYMNSGVDLRQGMSSAYCQPLPIQSVEDWRLK